MVTHVPEPYDPIDPLPPLGRKLGVEAIVRDDYIAEVQRTTGATAIAIRMKAKPCGSRGATRVTEQDLRIFVSSPGDVPDERRRVDLVVERLNTEFAERVRIETIRWESAYYSAHDTFQKQIPKPPIATWSSPSFARD